jgi:hypothetical protein
MNNVLKSPLFHFLVLGAMLFVVFAVLNPDSMEDDNKIVITKGDIKHIKDMFEDKWGRAPKEDELKILIHGAVLTEAYYKEGIKLGLDKNDAVIKKRIRQKMELATPNKEVLKKQQEQMLKNYDVTIEGEK